MSMKYCENCGAAMPEDSKFCTECGTPFPAVKKEEKPAAPTPAAKPAEPEEPAAPVVPEAEPVQPETVKAEDPYEMPIDLPQRPAAEPIAPAAPVNQPVQQNPPVQQYQPVQPTPAPVQARPAAPVNPQPAQPYAPGPVGPRPVPIPGYGSGEITAESLKGTPFESIGAWGWVGIFLLMGIPIVNLILLIVWACGGCRKNVKKSFARGVWLMVLISIVLAAVIGVTAFYALYPVVEPAINEILEQFGMRIVMG